MAELGPSGSSVLRAEVEAGEDATVLRLWGEMDISSVGAVRPVIDEALAGAPDSLVVDLSGLTFMDSSGIALLLSVAERVERMRLRHPSDSICRLIELTGLEDALPVDD